MLPVCAPLGPRGVITGWLSGEVQMKVGFVSWSMYMNVFKAPYITRKSSEWEEKVAGQVITVSRYTVTPDMRVLGAGLNLGSMADAFVRELSRRTWMRIFRNVCLDGY